MGKKKKPKKKRFAVSHQLASEEESLLAVLLENFKDITLANIHERIPSPLLAHVLIDKLPSNDPQTVNFLLLLNNTFKQKNVQKSIRKAAFRLKKNGIFMPALDKDTGTPVILKRPEQTEPSASLGPIDGNGDRAVFIAIPQVPQGFNVGIGLVNDEKGISQFIFVGYSKKRMKEVKELLFKRTGLMVDASIPHAATVLEKAYLQNQKNISEIPKEYLMLRPWLLENVSLLEEAAIYSDISLESISGVVLADGKINELIEHDLLSHWTIARDKIEPLLNEIAEVEDSPIMISEGQKTNRINEIKDRATAELYPDPKRQILKNSLEEMAYIFLKQGEEDYVHSSLAAAFSLHEEVSVLKVNPFLRAVLDRSLEYYMEVTEAISDSVSEEDPTSRIILP